MKVKEVCVGNCAGPTMQLLNKTGCDGALTVDIRAVKQRYTFEFYFVFNKMLVEWTSGKQL